MSHVVKHENEENRWREGGMHFGVLKNFVSGYASWDVHNLWRERIRIPKKVLKTELGKQNFLPPEMVGKPIEAEGIL